MRNAIVALRISRRAIGAVVLAGGEIAFVDGRHVGSDRPTAVPAATRYIRRLVEMTQPRGLVVDCPAKPGSMATEILEGLPQIHSAVARIPLADLLAAFGHPPPSTRPQLRVAAGDLFPELPIRSSSLRPFALDASAAALLAESQIALGDLRL